MCDKKSQTTLNIFGPFFLTRHGKEKGNGEAAQQSSLTVVCVRETKKKKKKKRKEEEGCSRLHTISSCLPPYEPTEASAIQSIRIKVDAP